MPPQYFERFREPIGRGHRHKGPASAETGIEVPGFLLGNTHPHQRTDNATRRRTQTNCGDRRCQNASHYQRTDTGNRQRAEQSHQPTDNAARHSPGRRFIGQSVTILGSFIASQRRPYSVLGSDPDLLIGERCALEGTNRVFGLGSLLKERYHDAAGCFCGVGKRSYIIWRSHAGHRHLSMTEAKTTQVMGE